MSDTIIVQPVVNELTVTEEVNDVIVSSVGVQGPAGAAGATGATGPQGPSGVIAVTAPITNSGTSTSANIGVSAGSTSAAGVLQLTDSVSSASTTTAATPNAVKTTYDLAALKLNTSAYNLSRGIPATSVETYPRMNAITPSTNNSSGTVRYSFLSPASDITVSSITFISGTTVGSGITLARFGIFTTDGTNLTLVARTASDTTIFTAGSTAYTRSLSTTGGYPSTYTLTAGTVYYIAFISVATSGSGSFAGGATSVINTSQTPALTYQKAGQTDLADTTIASLSSSAVPAWARLS